MILSHKRGAQAQILIKTSMLVLIPLVETELPLWTYDPDLDLVTA